MMKRILLVTIGLIFSLGAQAQTSCSLLSQCPNALLPLNGSEIMYIVQGGISRQVTTSNFMGVSTSILPLNNVWTGSNTFSNNINTNTIVNVGSFSSSITTTGTAIGAVLDNQFNCTDTQTVTGANTGKICLFVLQSYGGSGVSGVRQAIEAYGLLTSPTSPTNPDRFYTASTSTEEAQTGDGGFDTTTNASALLGATSISVTSTTGVTTGRLISIQLATVVNDTNFFEGVVSGPPSGGVVSFTPALPAAVNAGATVYLPQGELQGQIAQAQTDPGATDFETVVGFESNMSVIGRSPVLKFWVNATNNTNDVYEGVMYDAGYSLTSQSPTVHTQNGILFNPASGYFPVDSTGSLFTATAGPGSSASVANGLRWDGVEITNDLIFASVDSTGISASTIGPGLAIQDNITGGSGEIDIVNTFQTAITSLNILQKTGPTSYNTLMYLTSTGNMAVSGNYISGSSGGVTCAPGSPTSSFAVVGGIVTHC